MAHAACRESGTDGRRPGLTGEGRVRERFLITGTVQGVGFRPFVFRAALARGLKGWVANTGRAVAIDVEGPPAAVESFARALAAEAPPLARIAGIRRRPAPPRGYADFRVLPSRARPAAARAPEPADGAAAVPPDAALCPACRREVLDPGDRRHRHPFTCCTDCGPRFTIVAGLPFDRARTAMAPFPLCPECAREYADPTDRRFHAQAVACPACGPRVSLVDGAGRPLPGPWPEAARRMLRDGRILAVKGIGGFHLACDARSAAAVAELRRRKGRPARPFAVMCRDLAAAGRCARVDGEAAGLLSGPEAPVVLLPRRPGAPLAAGVAPGLSTVGVMLPYTPLHLLLFDDDLEVLVMTSGNASGLPLAAENAEAVRDLAGIADAFLLHDREILNPCDDSVVRIVAGEVRPLRRARGYVPAPVAVPDPGAPPGAAAGSGAPAPDVLGVGGQDKVTFCLLRGGRAVLSQHLGELGTVEARDRYRAALAALVRLTGCRPRVVGRDLHPGYATTRLAAECAAELESPAGGAAVVGVQHHHAHMAACMAENGLDGPVVGVVLDGTGCGEDGAVWGFEVLSGDYAAFRRHAHLAYVPLPGGERAVRRPWIMAATYLERCLGEAGAALAERLFPGRAAELDRVRRLAAAGFNSPPASSCGRLFDAVAALLGVCLENTYDGQAAAELGDLAEAAAASGPAAYPFRIAAGVIDPGPLLEACAGDLQAGVDRARIAARFHDTVAAMAAAAAEEAAQAAGLDRVVLSGGCFQNPLLLVRVRERLAAAGLRVWAHRRVPANDGGLSLGQAMVARARVSAGLA